MAVKPSKILLHVLLFYLSMLLVMAIGFKVYGADWVPEGENRNTWAVTEEKGVKWTPGSNPYETPEIDQPALGFYRTPQDYSIPDSWPQWAKNRFSGLSGGLSEADKKFMGIWSRPPLNTNTKWIDAKADKNTGAIEVTIPNFNLFTFVGIIPVGGTIEQDFKGHAKIYNLNDDLRYKIYAWDATDLKGTMITAISDKYIRALSIGNDLWGGARRPIMAQEVVEDPNKDIWTSVYDIDWNGSLYRFIDLYRLDKDFNIKAKFEVPLRTSYIKPWDTDLILKDNGNVVMAACESPEGYTQFNGPSFIAEIDRKTGATVWQTPQNNISSALAITKANLGYVYGGINYDRADFTQNPKSGDDAGFSGEDNSADLNNRWGILGRINESGVTLNWGSSGATTIAVDHRVRAIQVSKEKFSSYYFTDSVELSTTQGGSCSDNYTDPDPCSIVFDGSEGAGVGGPTDIEQGIADSNIYVKWDFGIGNAQEVTYAKVLTQSGSGDTGIIQYSDNDIDWSNLGSSFVITNAKLWREVQDLLVGSHRYYRFIVPTVSAGNLYTWEFNLYTRTQVFEEAPRFFTSGQKNIFSTKLTTDPGGVATGDPIATNPNAVFDGTLTNICQFPSLGGATANAYILFTFTNPVNLTWTKLWYNHADANATTIYLDYYDGSVWQNEASKAVSTGDYISWTVTPNVGYRTQWRFRIGNINIGATPSLDEWIMFDNIELYPVISAYNGASGVTEGVKAWEGRFGSGVSSYPGYFLDMTQSLRNQDLVAVGHTDASQTDFSQNQLVIGACNTSGVTIWYKTYSDMSVGYNVSPTKDGGYLVSGTLYTGTALENRSFVIMKIDDDGNKEWSKTFQEPGHWNDGRGVIETRDGGTLAVGGSSSASQDMSKPYFIKLDRFNRAETTGKPYD